MSFQKETNGPTEDPTQCCREGGRVSLTERLDMFSPYLAKVDTMLDSRGDKQKHDEARDAVEEMAREAERLGLKSEVLGTVMETLAGLPEGARGPQIADALAGRAKDADEKAMQELASGGVDEGQLSLVNGYVAESLLRMAADAKEKARMGGPRKEVLDATTPVGGQLGVGNWEALAEMVREERGDNTAEQPESQTEEARQEKETTRVDKLLGVLLGLASANEVKEAMKWAAKELGGVGHEAAERVKERIRASAQAEPAREAGQAEAAPAVATAPGGEQAQTNLQVAERLKDVADALKGIREGSVVTVSKFADALERVENAFREQKEKDPVSVAVKEYADSLKKDIECAGCGAIKGPGVCPFCGARGNGVPEKLLELLTTVLEKTAGRGGQRGGVGVAGPGGVGMGAQVGQLPFNYDSMDFMKRSKLESAQLARAAFLTVEKDGDNIYESIPLVPHGEIYYGLTKTEAEALAARIALSNGRARVQQAIKTEQVFPAPELMAISKASLEALSSMPGVSEATAIYAALITRPELMGQYTGQMGLPAKNLLDIGEKTELKTYRDAFAAYLGERFGLEAQDASNAEAVAYNFCKAFKVPESVDYRFYPEYQRTNRTRLSAVVNDTFRTLLDPAYKMLDAVEKVDNGGNLMSVQRGDRKGWPRNILGKWIIGNIDGAEGITRVWQKEPLVGNAFCEVDFVDENDRSDKLMHAGGDGRMEGALIDAAVGLVSGQRNEFHIDWKHAENETPLFMYEFGKIKPAQLIVTMLETLS